MPGARLRSSAIVTDDESRGDNLYVSAQHPDALAELDKPVSSYFNAGNVGLCVLDSSFRYIALNRHWLR